MRFEDLKRLPANDVPSYMRLGYAGNIFYAKVTEYVRITDDPDVTQWFSLDLESGKPRVIGMTVRGMPLPEGVIVVAQSPKGNVYFVNPNNVSDRYLGNENFW